MSPRWPRGAEWDQTDNLAVHADGRLFVYVADDDEWAERHAQHVGYIDRYPIVPDEYSGELAELLARWHGEPSRAELERERREEWEAGMG